MTTPILELRNINAGYGSIDVLHGVNLTVPHKVLAFGRMA